MEEKYLKHIQNLENQKFAREIEISQLVQYAKTNFGKAEARITLIEKELESERESNLQLFDQFEEISRVLQKNSKAPSKSNEQIMNKLEIA